jgi:hypothetical protein
MHLVWSGNWEVLGTVSMQDNPATAWRSGRVDVFVRGGVMNRITSGSIMAGGLLAGSDDGSMLAWASQASSEG